MRFTHVTLARVTNTLHARARNQYINKRGEKVSPVSFNEGYSSYSILYQNVNFRLLIRIYPAQISLKLFPTITFANIGLL